MEGILILSYFLRLQTRIRLPCPFLNQCTCLSRKSSFPFVSQCSVQSLLGVYQLANRVLSVLSLTTKVDPITHCIRRGVRSQWLRPTCSPSRMGCQAVTHCTGL